MTLRPADFWEGLPRPVQEWCVTMATHLSCASEREVTSRIVPNAMWRRCQTSAHIDLSRLLRRLVLESALDEYVNPTLGAVQQGTIEATPYQWLVWYVGHVILRLGHIASNCVVGVGKVLHGQTKATVALYERVYPDGSGGATEDVRRKTRRLRKDMLTTYARLYGTLDGKPRPLPKAPDDLVSQLLRLMLPPDSACLPQNTPAWRAGTDSELLDAMLCPRCFEAVVTHHGLASKFTSWMVPWPGDEKWPCDPQHSLPRVPVTADRAEDITNAILGWERRQAGRLQRAGHGRSRPLRRGR